MTSLRATEDLLARQGPGVLRDVVQANIDLDAVICLTENNKVAVSLKQKIKANAQYSLVSSAKVNNDNVEYEMRFDSKLASRSGELGSQNIGERLSNFIPSDMVTSFTYRYVMVPVCSDGHLRAKDDSLFGFAIEQRMVTHMNDDHVDAMLDYCSYKGIEIKEHHPIMAGVDRYGFNLLVGLECFRFTFDKACETALDVRHALVALAKEARSRIE